MVGETIMNRVWIVAGISAGAMLWGSSVLAQEGVTAAIAFYSLDNIVLLFSAILVLFMQAGFAALESGMSPLDNRRWRTRERFLVWLRAGIRADDR